MPTEKAFEKHDYAVTRSRFTPALQQETRQMIAKLAGLELNENEKGEYCYVESRICKT